jgi:polyisoprenoid-binding protein YceI
MPTATVTTPGTTALPTGTWKIDPVHSSVEFAVKHLGIATVASVDTREPQRDGHLLSPDFFDAEQFPEIAFRSTAISPVDHETVAIEGDLTIHGVTRRVALDGVVEGTETDPQGNERVGLSVGTQINRSDYGMKFNMALGSGNVVVSDKVKIVIEISAVRSEDV